MKMLSVRFTEHRIALRAYYIMRTVISSVKFKYSPLLPLSRRRTHMNEAQSTTVRAAYERTSVRAAIAHD